jgi:hypothetical protein
MFLMLEIKGASKWCRQNFCVCGFSVGCFIWHELAVDRLKIKWARKVDFDFS